jgi:hypothetical protein
METVNLDMAPPSEQSSGVAQVFLARANRALQELAESMSEPDLEAAASEAYDSGVLLCALESSSALTVLSHDPLAEARIRGLRMKQELLAREGGVLGASEVAEILGITRQAVNKRVQAKTLFALQTAKHGMSFPAWQLVDGEVLPGLPEVLRSLDPTLGPWMTLAFFLEDHVALGGRSPLQALREGDVESVLRAARTQGQHVAL